MDNEDSSFFQLASKLGAKNITNSPLAQKLYNQRQESAIAQSNLDSTRTAGGAIAGSIALYLQKKEEKKALDEYNAALAKKAANEAKIRESLISALPDDKRIIGSALEDPKDLAKYVADTLAPVSEEEKLSIENKRLQNQKLRREIGGVGVNNNRSNNIPDKLPIQALKLQNEALDIIGIANGINADLSQVRNQLETNKLKLGPIENIKSAAKNKMGISDEQSRNFSSFKATLEKLRNDSLRLNKGVQTEGDAKRAWDEILADINDEELVKERLAEVEKINKRGADFQKLQIDQIRANYGVPPIDFTQFENRPAALGTSGNGIFQASNGVKFTIKR